jgi:hypothetical protein
MVYGSISRLNQMLQPICWTQVKQVFGSAVVGKEQKSRRSALQVLQTSLSKFTFAKFSLRLAMPGQMLTSSITANSFGVAQVDLVNLLILQLPEFPIAN